MKPRVSVVMVVRNPHPRFFPLAVESILIQTFTDFELIIVEDPSPRSAEDTLNRHSDPRIRYIRHSRRTSLVQQRNRALAEARGEFMAICDADDIVVPNRLEKQLGFLHRHLEIDVLGAQIAVIDDHGEHLGYRAFPVDHDSIVESMTRIVPFCQPSVMMRTEAVRAVGGYRETGYLPEDYELWSRLAKNGTQFANHHEVLLHYRVHAAQMKAIYLREIIRGVLRVKQTYWREEMNLGARLQMWAERLLLLFPPNLVYRLLLRMYYRGCACSSIELAPPPPQKGHAAPAKQQSTVIG
ncbi:MAG: glycosyltransferase [Planctomycetes bacterium]|nr:glycosyltransferase [Planctomycetota bacterium]